MTAWSRSSTARHLLRISCVVESGAAVKIIEFRSRTDGPDKIWNAYNLVRMDDGTGYLTQAVKFGPTQHPGREELDNAGIFMSALLNAQQDFGKKIKEFMLLKLFIELHVAAQEARNIKSDNPKEEARSAYRRELKSATDGGIVQVKDGFVWEVEEA